MSTHATRAIISKITMLAGRYNSCWHWRHWWQHNGSCQIPGCGMHPPAPYSDQAPDPVAAAHPPSLTYPLHSLLSGQPELFIASIIDPATHPDFITVMQNYKHLAPIIFKLTRAWIWSIHKSRLRQRWASNSSITRKI